MGGVFFRRAKYRYVCKAGTPSVRPTLTSLGQSKVGFAASNSETGFSGFADYQSLMFAALN